MIIDRIIRFVLPRQDVFFTLLEELADKITETAAVFGELSSAEGREQLAEIARRIKPIETKADQVCHRVYDELDRTFVTPIDREDLAALTTALDDVIDGMEHAAAFTALFRFDRLTDPMRQMVRITTQAAAELARAAANLRKFNDPESIRGPTVAIHTFENEADALYRAAVEALFTDGVEARDLVRQKDMLFSLEKGVDRCEDAMDVIRSVVVKNG
jgi:predicted phosphate transport protein (TIGR00153 family)